MLLSRRVGLTFTNDLANAWVIVGAIVALVVAAASFGLLNQFRNNGGDSSLADIENNVNHQVYSNTAGMYYNWINGHSAPPSSEDDDEK